MHRRAVFLLSFFALWCGFCLSATAQSVCIPGPQNLCLNGGRFRAEITWRDFDGKEGKGQVVPLASDDSGLFWFFKAENWEVLVKVLDGCELNNRFWVFTSSATNIQYSLDITDTLTGVRRTYKNASGVTPKPVADTDAFPTCSPAIVPHKEEKKEGLKDSLGRRTAAVSEFATESTGCSLGDGQLCLAEGRFRVEVEWRDFKGLTGRGRAASLQSNDSGLIWFFTPDNLELLVKVVNGCDLNGRFWVFSAAATNVAYTLRVTDTYTGAVKSYSNRLGVFPLPVTDTEAFGGCKSEGPPVVSFLSEQSVTLTGKGQKARFEVRVSDHDGREIPSAEVTWSSDLTRVSLKKDGPRAVVATAISNEVTSVGISATYKGVSIDGLILLADKRPDTYMLEDDLIVSATEESIRLRRTRQTEALRIGQIIASSGDAGVLARVDAVNVGASEVVLATESVDLPDAFSRINIDVSGQPQLEKEYFVPNGYNVALLPPGSRVKSLKDFKCNAVGGGSIDLQSAGVIEAQYKRYPFLRYEYDEAVGAKALRIGVGIESTVVFNSGVIRINGRVEGEIRCSGSSTDARLSVIPVGYGLFVSNSIKSTPKIEFTLSYEGAGLEIGGTLGSITNSVELGLEYKPSTHSLTSFSDRSSSSKLDKVGPGLGVGTFSLDFEAGIDFELGYSVHIGPPGLFRPLLDTRFAELDIFGYYGVDFPLPLDPSRRDYIGPSWDLGIGSTGEIKGDISLPALERLLKFLKIEPSFEVSYKLFDFRRELGKSADLILAASPRQVNSSIGEEVSLSVQGSSSGAGSLEAWVAKRGVPSLARVAEGGFSGGKGTARWRPSENQSGEYDVYGRLRLDAISSIRPYATKNHEAISVVSVGASSNPIIQRVSPVPVPIIAGSQRISIYGVGFKSGAAVILRSVGGESTVTTSYVNPGELQLDGNFGLLATAWSVQVKNPDGSLSNEFEFLVGKEPQGGEEPDISNVAPNPVTASNSTQMLTILGSNFVSGAMVTLKDITNSGTYTKPTSYINSGKLTINANFTNATATWSVQVVNPDGRSSNAFNFQVQGTSATPLISSVSPNPVFGSNNTQTLTILGSNFAPGATATLNDLTNGGTYTKSTSYNSSGQLEISANFTNATASWSVQVTNPDGNLSNIFNFQVQGTSVTPSINSVSPNPVPGSNSTQTLAIFGSNFVSGATVTLQDLTNGGTYAKSTSYSNSGQLTISANFTNRTATWSAQVVNPDGSSSNVFNFQVQGTSVTPSISSVSPNPVPGSNSTQTLAIFGSNFVSGATVNLKDLTNGGTYTKSTSYSNNGQLTISANFTNATATWSAQVVNPDGSSSNVFNFQVQGTSVTPSISLVSPNPVPGSNSTQTLAIFGSNFVSGATVTLKDLTNGGTYTKSTSYSNSGQLTISANFTNTTATWSAQVVNPDGSSSNVFNFQVQGTSVTPSISSVSPNPVPGSNSTQTLTILGSNFVSGATVTLKDLTNGGTYTKFTSYSNSGQLTISANFTNATATWSAQVVNPDGSSSNVFNFQVQAISVTPSISSVSPNPVSGSNSTQTLTIFGSNFVSGATVTLKDLTNGGTYAKSTSYSNSGQLAISANFTNATATWSAQVVNPDGSSSNAFNFQVQATSVTPSISSVSPNPVSGSNSTQTLTIFGSNFVSGATVTLKDLTNGGTYTKSTSYSNSGQLSISANFTNTTATWSAQVVNPDGNSSNVFNFQVQATSVTPSISSVSPNPVSGSNSTQTLTIFGGNFVSGATVTLKDLTNGGTYTKSTSYSNSGQLSISANFTNTTATWSAQVVNPDGNSSNVFNFQVQATSVTPSISSVSPNPVSGSNSTQTLTIFGSNFVSGATVTLKDLTNGGTYTKSTSYSNSGQLSISANFTNTTATWSVQVVNPGGSTSNVLSFQVQATSVTPSISSVSPNPVPGSNSTQTLTIFGSNFVSGATVTLKDLTNGGTYTKSTSYSNSGQLSISANFTNATATWSVQVVNPGGSSSNVLNFQVQAR